MSHPGTKRKAIVVCGPTASGKTGLADEVAEYASEAEGIWAPTLVVDSMQVYRELPTITNQERERPAELVGITSVVHEWTMFHHRVASDEVLDRTEGAFVLDAGTGMYLNALLLDIDIAPKVPLHVRRKAEKVSAGSVNPRRFARENELEISGSPRRDSIWSGDLRYDAALMYLRPDYQGLDATIAQRSKKIVREGIEEAQGLSALIRQGYKPNLSVRASIGVRELLGVVSGEIPLDEAESRISARTRKLARRQIRWFDKLARTLQDRARVTVARDKENIPSLNSMFDILRA